MILHFQTMIGHCDKLDQFYGAHQALAGISIELHEGCTGLLGSNGAGKSTLLKSLLGQLPVPAGRIELLGSDPAVEPLVVRRQVGYLPERDVYLPGLSGLEQVAYLGQLSGLRRSDALSRAHEVLHTAGLGEARYRPVDGYSTGMRQRVKLAGCLVHGPRLLLLDEPTSGLDPAGREEMLALIAELAGERGLSVLLSSHILADVERTCRRVVVLDEGRVLFSGDRAAFQAAEEGRLVVRVKAERALMAARLRAAGCAVEAPVGAAELQVVLPEGAGPALIWRTAREAGLQLRQLSSLAGSLEEAYGRALTQAEPPPAPAPSPGDPP